MRKIPELSTPRLTLRPLRIDDAGAIQSRFPQFEIVRYLNAVVPWPYPEDGALTYLRDVALPAIEAGREWHWTLRPKVGLDELIGVISLKRDSGDDHRGFWLAPEWQGQGLMNEAAEAVSAFWFETLGEPVLRVSKAVANQRSRRISARGGMRLVAVTERNFVSGRLPSEVWEITREEWRAQRQKATHEEGRERG
ncbi:GNAT family N-acetyltransferase [Afifella marina]|uniref:Protein N-acetyltransferase, RimJ/RimL family n=1 Tax=Afifella marina DSM 2698 TaxID=1120955 RepID=A0A1G5NS32_AFIMA|nr:GNAT family N-acetyltransferase [Afifella marina]MBK1624692.1 N-acetyltransferase [Afifella marina DSM 2698]MBK1627371.1 N-acetyltransferase [Afifella marina]MBK5915863.1 GNAT family N-acetyltransferase [Afifella marina]RAI20593.1 GNAT family N-acetyltransferase [Afifella marina DSM 2698]SCZ39599.1 Protein N-acetyltransferase, RimJ/RimL family [Afifella marina DSM 2698]